MNGLFQTMELAKRIASASAILSRRHQTAIHLSREMGWTWSTLTTLSQAKWKPYVSRKGLERLEVLVSRNPRHIFTA